ncbi:MAG: hypothetical protein IJS22_08815 [Lachnospiraceae bacterium]|nr:hypothetical protein [Lachnospiraceae bacterium]
MKSGTVLNSTLKECARSRLEYLESVSPKLKRCLETAPEGTLRVTSSRGRDAFYLFSCNSPNGKYITKDQMDLAGRIAQREYVEKLVASSEEEKRAIARYLNRHCPSIEEVFISLPPGRQRIVKPVERTDADFIRDWLSESHTDPDFYPGKRIFQTNRGELVRSKSEVLIADALDRAGIPYVYEKTRYLKGFGITHSDFSILNIRKRQEIVWEHNGMMGDPDYAESTVKKNAAYIKNGYVLGDNLIYTFESANVPLDPWIINKTIELHCI